jgi:RNA polymerase sigma factor (sigma-70 family)
MNTMSFKKNNEQERILQNEKLAMKLAHRYAKQYQGRHDYDDLAQAARLGILEAARTYDPSRGTAFSTHAYHRARDAISHFLKKNTGVIHIPYKAERDDSVEKPICANLPERWEDCVVTGDDTLSTFEGRIVLEGLMSELTARQREVLKLVFFNQYTYDEVAAELSITRQTAHATAKRALKKLRYAAQKHNLELSDLMAY